jgi:AcrR family transcriptional regulator
VLDVAREVLINDGLDQFVMRHIAQRAEIQLGNLQYYFASRDDLLKAVIRAEFDRDLATLRRAIATPAGPADGLADVARGLVENWCTGGSSVFMALALLAYHHERFTRLNAEIYETF